MNQDFQDLLVALAAARVRFLVVGAHAMAAHGTPRATGDLDVWVEPDPGNAARVWKALDDFGAPAEALGFAEEDLHRAGTVWQIGAPPRRIDIMTEIDGVDFAAAWEDRLEIDLEGTTIPILGLSSLRANKEASGRAKDLADLELLPKA